MLRKRWLHMWQQQGARIISDSGSEIEYAQHGFTGTPVIVRSDGAVIEGYRPREVLAAWLKSAKS